MNLERSLNEAPNAAGWQQRPRIGRMAVAQPVGTRATENLVFSDIAAGKTGPIAWQMHNAGLFDEFKDVRIEVDPREDRLITLDH